MARDGCLTGRLSGLSRRCPRLQYPPQTGLNHEIQPAELDDVVDSGLVLVVADDMVDGPPAKSREDQVPGRQAVRNNQTINKSALEVVLESSAPAPNPPKNP